ncbi:MAG: alpha-galactosidase, partial [Candidatus Hydrogenedentota bacterium]
SFSTDEEVRSMLRNLIGGIVLILATGGAIAEPFILENGDIQLILDVSNAETARISKAARIGDNETVLFIDTSNVPLSAWVPEDLVDVTTSCTGWQRMENNTFIRAEASRPLAKGLEITWRVDLVQNGSLIRLQTLLANAGNGEAVVEWFPIWNAAWQSDFFNGPIRYWDALTFVHHDQPLQKSENLTLASQIHSSDTENNGTNPYWRFAGSDGAAYFGLEWCGGWQADLKSGNQGVGFQVFLPPIETQLVLKPGETIAGPVLNVVFAQGGKAQRRADWIRQRLALAEHLYGGPAPSYPFTWNHWYSVRFDIDGPFFQRQMDAMPPYDFDYFIVDAGWYEACGKWDPDPNKFEPGEFQNAMAQIADLGVKPGIWTCPQFVHPDYIDDVPLNIDEPGFYRKFINGRLVDMAGSDFSAYLVEHVRKLRDDYHVGWWKYDQDFFTGELSKGRMRNVIALQDALLAVRKDQPDLYIENCQSGGRMINEFTVLLAQGQWIRDGGHTGLGHARSNLKEALGAIEFMPPWTVIRWVNRPYDNNTEDDEFTRMYCRGAMAGVWGIVADLPKIPDHQREVIIEEIAHYRRLNETKRDNLYKVYPAIDGADAAGVMYWTADASRAALLLLRWDAKKVFTKKVKIPFAADGEYRIENIDNKETKTHSGEELRQNGLGITFQSDQLSAIVFFERAE